MTAKFRILSVVLLMLFVFPASVMGTAYTKWAVVTDAEFGAVGDGATDDTAAIQAALDTGLPVFFPNGSYIVTDQLDIVIAGQIISGQSRSGCRIYIQTSGANEFNDAAAGVFVLSTAAKNVVIRDLWIEFNQPSTATRSDYVQPPAIYAQGVTGLTVLDCHIQEAWQGLDLRGNTDGTWVKNLEISAFDAGVMIDGLEGVAHFDGVHFWVFYNLVGYQDAVMRTYNLTDNVDPNLGAAFRIGDVSSDGMVYIQNLMHNCAYGVVMQSAGGVTPRVTIKSSWMEYGNGILQLAGELYAENIILGTWETRVGGIIVACGGYLFRQMGGTAVLRGVRALAWTDCAEAFSIYGSCSLTNSSLTRNGADDAGAYRIHVYSGGSLVMGNTILHNSLQYGNPWVYVDSGGLIQQIGCRYTEGMTLTVAADSNHIVVGNIFGNSSYDAPVIPSPRVNMVFENNIYWP